jgi:murein endopeptidase
VSLADLLLWGGGLLLLSENQGSSGAQPWPLGDPQPNPLVKSPVAPAGKAGGYGASSAEPPASWAQVPTTGPSWRVRRPSRAWGSPEAVADLVAALQLYPQLAGEGAPEVVVGDMSLQGGGPMPPHVSHQTGRDVDLSFAGKLPTVPTAWLLFALLQSDNVAGIFVDTDVQRDIGAALAADDALAPGLLSELQWPGAPHTGSTRVRHWPGHRNHVHARYRA